MAAAGRSSRLRTFSAAMTLTFLGVSGAEIPLILEGRLGLATREKMEGRRHISGVQGDVSSGPWSSAAGSPDKLMLEALVEPAAAGFWFRGFGITGFRASPVSGVPNGARGIREFVAPACPQVHMYPGQPERASAWRCL
jgi:hypothetical protein